MGSGLWKQPNGDGRVATFDVLYPHKSTYGDDSDSDATTPYILLQPVPDLNQIFEDYPPPEDREALGLVYPLLYEILSNRTMNQICWRGQ
jgi:hypothetical protein